MFAARPPAADRRIDSLERLAALLAAGALSRAEFEREKRRVLGDEGDPAPARRHGLGAAGARKASADARPGWFILGLALLALVAWITFAEPDPRAAPVAAVVPPSVAPGRADGGAIPPAMLVGGWVDERRGCALGDKDRFEYFGADGRYGGWGGFGGYAEEGRWALNGATLVETITHRTSDNETRAPTRLAEPQVRTFRLAQPAPGHLTVTGPSGGVGRLLHCPDAHFEFSARG